MKWQCNTTASDFKSLYSWKCLHTYRGFFFRMQFPIRILEIGFRFFPGILVNAKHLGHRGSLLSKYIHFFFNHIHRSTSASSWKIANRRWNHRKSISFQFRGLDSMKFEFFPRTRWNSKQKMCVLYHIQLCRLHDIAISMVKRIFFSSFHIFISIPIYVCVYVLPYACVITLILYTNYTVCVLNFSFSPSNNEIRSSEFQFQTE